MARPVRAGLDLDANAGLQTGSATDRITDENGVFEYFDSAWWHTSTTSNYPFAGSSTAKQVSKVRKRVTGLTSTLRGETRTYDAEGNETRVTVEVDAANKLVTTTTERPGMLNDQVDKALNGLAIEATGHDGLVYKKRYDALGRLTAEIEPRTGTESTPSTQYIYHTNSTWVKEVKDAANKRLSFTHYDSAGRVIYTEDAAGKTTRTAYTARGEVDKVWGTATYPVSYVYNSYGERTILRTYRDSSGSALTDTTSFPSVGTADETTWEYDVPSGLLKKKTDAKGKFVEYTYNGRGQTYERFWSRKLSDNTTRVKATFAYFGDGSGEPKTAELKSVTYNDGTATVEYAFSRTGQTEAVIDATGTRDFVYHTATPLSNALPWRLEAEVLPTSGSGGSMTYFYGDRHLTRTYDSGTSTSGGSLASHTLGTVVGRAAGLRLGTSTTPAADLQFSYPVSNTGRIAGVISTRDNNNSAASRTFTYGYETNSALLKSMAITGSHAFTLTREFETYRDLITNVEAKWSTNSRTKYQYAYNDLRQRQSVVQSGDVFADYGGSDNGAIHQIFTYNGRGEVTAAGTFLGATATDQSIPLSARKHEFDYDGIGNRKWSNTSGVSGLRDDYTVNELNQYTLKENNTLSVGGTVANDSNIKVAARLDGLAGRQGRYWGDNITLENWVAPYQGSLTVYAVNATTNKKMTQTRTAFIPPIAQAMTYDEDGNITNDGVWTYTWDAENRLSVMETTANAIAGGVPAQRLEFKYDYMHRRVEKRISSWSGTAWVPDFDKSRRFLYDGWSVVAEFKLVSDTAIGVLVRSYTWGLDIAKSLTDAGGVGALLQIHDHTVGGSSGKDYLPSYDGNGNIAALFDADTTNSGRCVAAYEYSPYGEFLRCEVNPILTEPEQLAVAAQPFRFSTKYTDAESGMVYYGRRYYSPGQGRFLGRDPIEEKGGLNLYGFCGNNSINLWDVLGMEYRIDSVSDGNGYTYSTLMYNGSPDEPWENTGEWFASDGTGSISAAYAQHLVDTVRWDGGPRFTGSINGVPIAADNLQFLASIGYAMTPQQAAIADVNPPSVGGGPGLIDLIKGLFTSGKKTPTGFVYVDWARVNYQFLEMQKAVSSGGYSDADKAAVAAISTRFQALQAARVNFYNEQVWQSAFSNFNGLTGLAVLIETGVSMAMAAFPPGAGARAGTALGLWTGSSARPVTELQHQAALAYEQAVRMAARESGDKLSRLFSIGSQGGANSRTIVELVRSRTMEALRNPALSPAEQRVLQEVQQRATSALAGPRPGGG